jgi:hypothetical protein
LTTTNRARTILTEPTPPHSSDRVRREPAGSSGSADGVMAARYQESPAVYPTPQTHGRDWSHASESLTRLPKRSPEQKAFEATLAPYFPNGHFHIAIFGHRDHWTDLLIAREVRRREAERRLTTDPEVGPGRVRSQTWETAPDPLRWRICRYCGERATDVDHVWPRNRGGDDHPNNLVPACEGCNSRKSGRSLFSDQCPACTSMRHPSDMETATGRAFYACRCGSSWSRTWDLQNPPLPTPTP